MKQLSVGFTSDLHLGHDLAAKQRGYASVEEHDADIIYTLMQQCNKRTLLFVLGDVAMQEAKIQLLNAVLGRKILIIGNHDQYPLESYLRVFEDIRGFSKYKNMWLSHCPIHPQEMYRAKANVHGHIHKNAATGELPFPYINVNWDFHKKAVSLDYIREIINNNEINTRVEAGSGIVGY